MTDEPQPQPEAPPAEEPEPTDEEVAAGAQKITLELVQLSLNNARINVVRNDESDGRLLVVEWPVILRMMLPLDADAARIVARGLTGGIEPASSLPAALAAEKIIRR